MNSAVNELIRSITGKNTLKECSVNELQQIASHYPYFGPAQFLLAQKLKEEGSLLHKSHFQKASLYFQNPLWLDLLINDPDINETVVPPEMNESSFELTRKTETRAGEEEIINETKEEQPEQIQQETITETKSSFEPVTEIQPLEEKIIEPITEQQFQQIEEESITETGASSFEPVTEIEIQPLEEKIVEPTPEQQSQQIEEEPITETIESSFESITPVREEKIIALIAEEEQPEQEQPAAFIEMPQLKIEPLKDQGTVLTFEPYHTIDYFASQGIRSREEEKPKDRFDQQLKSFTEWLKTLKRLPDSEISASAASIPDQKVEQMAERSITDRDVVTEAMADVWEKQGNPEKAIEIYRKLSLSNPGKSSYFATKIEHLKHL